MNDIEKYLEEETLDDIAFFLNELKEHRWLYHRNAVSERSGFYSKLVNDSLYHLKRTKDYYEQRFGKKPDIKNAWRIFRRNRANITKTTGQAGNTNNNNTILK